jgi:hypothetical protein
MPNQPTPDHPTIDERLAVVEEAVARFGTLARHVSELESTVENHGLLLARLLDEAPGQ